MLLSDIELPNKLLVEVLGRLSCFSLATFGFLTRLWLAFAGLLLYKTAVIAEREARLLNLRRLFPFVDKFGHELLLELLLL